jgi:hypothetical protein
MRSESQAALNPFVISDKENYPSIDEVFTAAVESSGDGSLPSSVSIDHGSSTFQHDLPMLASKTQMQQMEAADRNFKARNREWWKAMVNHTSLQSAP